MRKPRERREASPGDLRVLRAGLAVLLSIRAAAAFLPGTWLWGANDLRFALPAVGWTLWAAAALALIPSVGIRVAPALQSLGDAIAEGRPGVRIGAALAAAALVLALQDRTFFVGDALLRLGAANTLQDPRVLEPGGAGQLLPLDVFLHYHLPKAFVGAQVAAPVAVARVLGALDAALFALLAIELARALALRGVAATAAAATAFFGCALFLFTGYAKSYTELCVVTAAVAVYALRAIRGDGGLLPLGIAATAGALLHRSAVALAPATVLAWAAWLRRPRERRDLRVAIPAIALPILTALALLPRIVHTMGALDVRRHLAVPHAATAAAPAAELDPAVRVADLVSFVLFAAPLVALVPFLWPRIPAEKRRGPEAAVLLALALPFVALLVALRGQEGTYRDWDVFATSGVALAIFAAWAVGRALGASRAAPALALAVVLAAAGPAFDWLALFHDAGRGLRRAATFAVEPPRRPDPERVATWDHLGSMAFSRGDFAGASLAFAHAAELAPSLRILYTLGLALERSGRPRDAQVVLRSAVRRDSSSADAWAELRNASIAAGDLAEARRAARVVARLRADDPRESGIVARLDSLAAAGGADSTASSSGKRP